MQLFSRARRIRDELGFNIALPVQPGHGPRRDAWPPYPNMDPLTNVAGMMRVVSEVRAGLEQMRGKRVPKSVRRAVCETGRCQLPADGPANVAVAEKRAGIAVDRTVRSAVIGTVAGVRNRL